MVAHAKPEQKQDANNTVQKKEPEKAVAAPNQTGIPDTMKARFENLSGFSFDDVRVHYNSGKPAQLQALAYTQGNQVYVSPGQEKHLGHELGHVVQQKAGRVIATGAVFGEQINNSSFLEQEATAYGNAPLQMSKHDPNTSNLGSNHSNAVIQAIWIDCKDSLYYMWDDIVEGLLWFHHKSDDLMYFEVKSKTKTSLTYAEHAGVENAKPFSEWEHRFNARVLSKEDPSICDTFQATGFGNSKTYFSDPKGKSRMGWLALRDERSDELQSEIATRETLISKGLGSILAKHMIPGAPPKELLKVKATSGTAKDIPETGFTKGVWTSHIPNYLSIKANQMARNKVLNLKPEHKTIAKQGLQEIHDSLHLFYNDIGEIEIVFHTLTGKPYLVDVAPTSKGAKDAESLKRVKDFLRQALDAIKI